MFEHAVIIPSLDPDEHLEQTVKGLIAEGFERIIVVDDGSGPSFAPVYDALEPLGVAVVRHSENRGQGAAIKTGVKRAMELWPDAPGAVHVDADGQHLPADVAAVVREALAHPDAIVYGVRDFSGPDIPLRSRIGNAISALHFFLDTGVKMGDTQTGLRCVPASLVDTVLDCPGDRYEFCMDYLTGIARAKLPMRTVPIQTIYYEGNRVSHFHPVRDSIRIFRSFFRYAAASLASSGVDIGLFALLSAVLPEGLAGRAAIATVGARLVSGLFNFILNRNYSFSAAEGKVSKQGPRYLVLFLSIMGLSALFVTLLERLPIPLVLTKALVDTVLFLVSYFAQKRWVFVD